MNEKALKTLEFPKVLALLERETAFPVSREMAAALRPAQNLQDALSLLEESSEARFVLDEEENFSIGGARDIREPLNSAGLGQPLTPADLLVIKSTLVSARSIARRFSSEDSQSPRLSEIAQLISIPDGLVDDISKSISPRGEILDSASEQLGRVRSQLRVAHDRLLASMQKFLSNTQYTKYLQEAIITQREGRYVLPIKAEAKGRIKAIVHDKSASGATLFVEPLQVVELNNQWRELQLGERDEEQRILLALSGQVSDSKLEISAALEALARFDLAIARGRLARRMGANVPELLPLKAIKGKVHPGVSLRLLGARHPLLDPESVVALDVELHAENYCIVITGPNTGGKTVTLKTVGLLSLMAQSGMHIPAEAGSQISFFNAIFADIGDEQSIEQSLSTFSGHISNIVQILDEADQNSLVIFDELGAGTDPQEGAALANAILDHLVQRGVTTLVATHYSELKAYAYGTPGVVNASVEFDLKSLAPTYHLTVGLPGRSNALAIAKRLGLNERVIAAAKASIDPADLQAEDLLDEIHRERDRSREARKRTEQAQKSAEEKQKELAQRLENIEDERLEVLEKSRADAKKELDGLQSEIDQMRGELAKAQKPLDEIGKIEKKRDKLEKSVQKPEIRKQIPESGPSRPLRLGDQVRVRSLNRSGIVTAIGENEAEIQIGALRARTRLGEIEILAEEDIKMQEESQIEPINISFRVDSPGSELSLRGQRAEAALDNLDRYLDKAYTAGLHYARIIHGKGTGKLRELVRNELKRRDYVERFESALPHEGGEGVTVVFFHDS